jgi:hypothetical protein
LKVRHENQTYWVELEIAHAKELKKIKGFRKVDYEAHGLNATIIHCETKNQNHPSKNCHQ